MQKSLIVKHPFKCEPEWVLRELNSHLERGWKVVSVTPMGGAGGGDSVHVLFSALVILERVDE